MLKVGLISGTGSGLKRTLPALSNSSIARVSVVHGRDLPTLNRIADDFKVDVTTNIDYVLRSDVDLLYVASPPAQHLEQLRQVHTSGLPIIVEKPLCLTAEDTEEIRKLEVSQLMVAHHLRHQESMRTIRSVVRDGTLGPVRSAVFQWNYLLSPEAKNARWKNDLALGGAHALYDAGVHLVDLAQFLFGLPKSVEALGRLDGYTGRYPDVVASLEYDRFFVTLSAATNSDAVSNDLFIQFAGGSIFIANAFSETASEELIMRSAAGYDRQSFNKVNLYRAEVEQFCKFHFVGTGLLETSFDGTSEDEAIDAVRILNAIDVALNDRRRFHL